MENFIRSSTAHTAKCGGHLVLIKRDTSKGAYMRHIWKCRRCGGEFEQQNCDMVRSTDVARGCTYSMQQPDFNLRLVTASTLTGVNLRQVSEFMTGQMAVKIAADMNMRKQETKPRQAVTSVFEERKIENQVEHVAAARASEKYCGDVEWEGGKWTEALHQLW